MLKNCRIFFSYSHQDITIANEIDKTLGSIGLNLIRDIRDLPYMGDLKKFMERVRESDYIIMLLSDAYLKSPNCMYEVLQLVKDPNYQDRILAIRHGDDQFFSVDDQMDIINYWGKQLKFLAEKKANANHSLDTDPIDKQLRICRQINAEIGDFLGVISNLLHKTYADLKEEGYKSLLGIIGFDEIELVGEFLKLDNIEPVSKRNRQREVFEKAYPNFWAVPFHKANEICMFDPETAIEYYNECITLKPETAVFYNNRGVAYMHLEKPNSAKRDYDTAIEKDNYLPSPYNNRGQIEFQLGNLEVAMKYYNAALKLNPEFALAHYNRGMIHAHPAIMKTDEAIKDFSKSIFFDSNFASAYSMRAALNKILKGNMEAACADWRKAAELGDEEARKKLSQYCQE